MNKKYKIGEFSKLCRVTVKTLRHYEEQGLLLPDEIDRCTGYRYYRLGQAVRLNRILHLKQLGLSLEEIGNVLNSKSGTPDVDTVMQKIEHCSAEIERLNHQLSQLKSLLEISTNTKSMNEFKIKSIAARKVASHRRVIESYDILGMLCVNVIGPEMMRVGCTCPEPQYCYTVEHDAEHKDHDIDVEYCEAVGELLSDTPILHFYEAPAIPKALCYDHVGPYTTFSDSMAKVLRHIEDEGLQIIGAPRFSYIDGAWNKEDEAEWRTEIQVPVK